MRKGADRIWGLAALLPLLGVAASASTADLRVKSITNLTNDGGRVDWLRTGSQSIVFDRVNSTSGFYDVWTMNPDGSNQVCVTCGKTQVPAYNRGNPAWHPSGNFIVFQAQKTSMLDNNLGRPGVGVNNDVWIMNAAGTQFWQVSDVTRGNGVLHPHFSNAGDKLMWAELVSPYSSLSPSWVIRLASVQIVNNAPVISNVQTLTPGSGVNPNPFYETHSFSPDDSTIFFSADLQPGQTEPGIDQYSYNLNTHVLTDLTNTLNQWDEHGQIRWPQGDHLMWISSMDTGYNVNNATSLKADYWMMTPDGGNQVRLTYYNDPLSSNYVAAGLAGGDSSWNADGTQSVAYLIGVTGGATLGGTGSNVILQFEPAATTVSAASFQRGPVAPDSLASLFNANLTGSLQKANNVPWPLSLGGTTVFVTDAKGVQRQAPLLLVSPSNGQVNYMVPDGTAPGPGMITVTDGASGAVTRGDVYIQGVAPALFSENATGHGVAAAYTIRVAADGSVSPLDLVFDCSSGQCAPKPISLNTTDQVYLVLFGTGIRGAGALSDVSVQIGSQSVPVQYAGDQKTYPGLDQINVKLPSSLAGSGLVNVAVSVAGNPANTVQIQIQ